MRFGLPFLPDCSPCLRSATAYYDDSLAQSRGAVAADLDSAKTPERRLRPHVRHGQNAADWREPAPARRRPRP